MTTIGFAPAVTFFMPSRTMRLSQQGRGGGAVAGSVVGLGGNFLDELCAHILKGVVKLDLLGNGHAVVGDERSAELFVQNNVAAFGAEGDFYCVSQLVDAGS